MLLPRSVAKTTVIYCQQLSSLEAAIQEEREGKLRQLFCSIPHTDNFTNVVI